MTDDRELLESLLAGVAEPLRPLLREDPTLGAWLADAVVAARTAWPAVSGASVDFARDLGARITTPESAALLRRIRITDLYLAWACAGRDPKALAAFEERYEPQIARALRRMRLAPSVAEDLLGPLREQLFFGIEGTPPLIAQYAGRGELGSWVRSVAVRAALKIVRRDHRNTQHEDVDLLAPNTDPELLLLKQLYASELEAAMSAALASLSVKDRNLLRQHYLDGLTVDALARMHGVHKATAARWIVTIREALLHGVREYFATRLALSEDAFESVLRLARSEMNLSVSRLLRA